MHGVQKPNYHHERLTLVLKARCRSDVDTCTFFNKGDGGHRKMGIPYICLQLYASFSLSIGSSRSNLGSVKSCRIYVVG